MLRGSRVYYLSAPADSESWTLINFSDLGNEVLCQLLFNLRSDDLAAEAAASLTIRAGPSPKSQSRVW